MCKRLHCPKLSNFQNIRHDYYMLYIYIILSCCIHTTYQFILRMILLHALFFLVFNLGLFLWYTGSYKIAGAALSTVSGIEFIYIA